MLGEVTAQYAGLSLSDPKYEPYLALAEEFDVPVPFIRDWGRQGISYDPCCRGFRASLGNPALLEEALNRHPKLRVNVMHGGWPYLQETIAVLSTYPQVYTDLGSFDLGPAATRVPRLPWRPDARRIRQARDVRVRPDVLARSHRHGGRRDSTRPRS